MAQVTDEELALHLREAWRLIAPEKLHVLLPATNNSGSRS
jgi:hypothetical protein